MGPRRAVSFVLDINGKSTPISSAPEMPLAYVLRNELNLRGTKIGCGLEQCGACHVMADGEAVPTCAAPAASFEGRKIVTVEGLSATRIGRNVQDAFVAHGAAQCGYCTAGLVVAVTSLLRQDPAPSRDTARKALAPNLCRCGSHPRVLDAVAAAAARS